MLSIRTDLENARNESDGWHCHGPLVAEARAGRCASAGDASNADIKIVVTTRAVSALGIFDLQRVGLSKSRFRKKPASASVT